MASENNQTPGQIPPTFTSYAMELSRTRPAWTWEQIIAKCFEEKTFWREDNLDDMISTAKGIIDKSDRRLLLAHTADGQVFVMVKPGGQVEHMVALNVGTAKEMVLLGTVYLKKQMVPIDRRDFLQMFSDRNLESTFVYPDDVDLNTFQSRPFPSRWESRPYLGAGAPPLRLALCQ